MKNKTKQRWQAPRAPKGKPSRPARNKHTVFRQVCNWIPAHMIPQLAREHKIDARGFSAASHVLSVIYTHTAHTLRLHETCDALALHEAEFLRIRGATAPARNTFSNANRTRDPALAEALYWKLFAHLQDICPGFTQYRKHKGFTFRLQREMTFITNNTNWSARSIAELYRARWCIELFFKELEQTLQLRDFVGTNENAVKWQVWRGLITHLLLRCLRHITCWGHSFSRFAGLVRSALWVKTNLLELLRCYGTEGAHHRPVLSSKDPYLPGFAEFCSSPMGQQV